MISLFKKASPKPPEHPANSLGREDRKKAFWLLKKYSSITSWERQKVLHDRLASELERLAGTGDTVAEAWLKVVLDEVIEYEKAMARLKRGDRSCFLWGVEGSFSHTNRMIPELQQKTRADLYSFDEDLLSPLIQILNPEQFPMSVGEEGGKAGLPASWMPHWLLNEHEHGPFNFPDPLDEVPLHDPLIQVKTDDEVPYFGIWEPNTPGTCMNYLQAGRAAPQVRLPGARHENTTWTLLWVDHRYENGAENPEEPLYYAPGPVKREAFADHPPRMPANNAARKEGWWYSPAGGGRRQYFKVGEVFPEFSGDYGLTFWQWDVDQSMPKL